MAADAVSQPAAGWDEAQCTAALAQLERLKEQLDDLRLTIPRVVEPFYAPPTPAMFRAFKEGLVTSQNDIKRFRNQWHNQETQSTFEHTRQSLNKNSDLSASAQVPQYGWIEKEERSREAAKHKKDDPAAEEAKIALTKEDVTRIVEDFRKTNPNISLVTKNDNRDLMIQFVSNSTKLRFHVTIEQEANGQQHKLNAECLGTTEPFVAITRCIASRPNANDLRLMATDAHQDMIAAYRNIKGTACAKCEKMLDVETTQPLARRSRQIVGANEMDRTVWAAFHEGCVE